MSVEKSFQEAGSSLLPSRVDDFVIHPAVQITMKTVMPVKRDCIVFARLHLAHVIS